MMIYIYNNNFDVHPSVPFSSNSLTVSVNLSGRISGGTGNFWVLKFDFLVELLKSRELQESTVSECFRKFSLTDTERAKQVQDAFKIEWIAAIPWMPLALAIACSRTSKELTAAK